MNDNPCGGMTSGAPTCHWISSRLAHLTFGTVHSSVSFDILRLHECVCMLRGNGAIKEFSDLLRDALLKASLLSPTRALQQLTLSL